MSCIDPRLVAVEQQNRAFWASRSARRSQQMADVGLCRNALRILADEQFRLPVHQRRTLEQALDDSEAARAILVPAEVNHLIADETKERKSISAVEIGRKGGLASKCDALSRLIVDVLAENPRLTPRTLLDSLHEHCDIRHVIDEIDHEMIYFHDSKGGPKTAPVSGLKHRLSRARRTIASR